VTTETLREVFKTFATFGQGSSAASPATTPPTKVRKSILSGPAAIPALVVLHFLGGSGASQSESA
jgi:hypothetical protein